MDNNIRAALAAGAATGYVAGRSNKGKLAIGLLSLAVGSGLDPVALIGRGSDDSPRVSSSNGSASP